MKHIQQKITLEKLEKTHGLENVSPTSMAHLNMVVAWTLLYTICIMQKKTLDFSTWIFFLLKARWLLQWDNFL